MREWRVAAKASNHEGITGSFFSLAGRRWRVAPDEGALKARTRMRQSQQKGRPEAPFS
jgi:hypothetical protein